MKDGNEAAQSTRGFNVIFIHSSLDDAGLTPQQFRVLAHITRRAGDGSAWASNETIAEVCRIDKKTAVDCLSVLEGRRILSRNSRPGKTTVWTINPPSKWNLEKPEKPENGRPVSNPTRTTPQPEQPPRTQPEQPPTYPTRTTPHEGNPLKVIQKGNPKKRVDELPPVPEALVTTAFVDSWKEWLDYRKSKGKPVSSFAAKRQFKQFAEWGADKSVRAIEQSITKDWQGIFEPDEKKNVINGFSRNDTIVGFGKGCP